MAKDKHIRYNELERLTLLQAGVASFILVSGNLNGADMADAFTKALDKIRHFVLHKKRPFIAKVDKTGNVSLWIDHKGKVRT